MLITIEVTVWRYINKAVGARVYKAYLRYIVLFYSSEVSLGPACGP